MKISDLVELSGIQNEYKISMKGLLTGNGNKLPIYSNQNVICFYKGETCQGVGADKNCENQKYKIRNQLEEWFGNMYSKGIAVLQERYLSIAEILLAIEECIGKKVFTKDCVQRYAEKTKEQVDKELDLSTIQRFDALSELIRSNIFYSELWFKVEIWECKKNDRYVTYLGEKAKFEYGFGNRKYHEELDVVNIIIYQDWYELCYKRKGTVIECERETMRKRITDEEKILAALNEWDKKYDFCI